MNLNVVLRETVSSSPQFFLDRFFLRMHGVLKDDRRAVPPLSQDILDTVSGAPRPVRNILLHGYLFGPLFFAGSGITASIVNDHLAVSILPLSQIEISNEVAGLRGDLTFHVFSNRQPAHLYSERTDAVRSNSYMHIQKMTVNVQFRVCHSPGPNSDSVKNKAPFRKWPGRSGLFRTTDIILPLLLVRFRGQAGHSVPNHKCRLTTWGSNRDREVAGSIFDVSAPGHTAR